MNYSQKSDKNYNYFINLLLVKVLRWGKKKTNFEEDLAKTKWPLKLHFGVVSYSKILQLIELGRIFDEIVDMFIL